MAFNVNSLERIGIPVPFPSESHDDEEDGLKFPETIDDFVYNNQRMAPTHYPKCIFVPNITIMF